MGEMNQLREYELKHGRVAMAAVFGLIVEPYIHPLAKSCHLAHPTDPILSGVELNYGRLAMVAFAGFITQYGLYGNVDDMLFKPMLKPASELTCYGWLCV